MSIELGIELGSDLTQPSSYSKAHMSIELGSDLTQVATVRLI